MTKCPNCGMSDDEKYLRLAGWLQNYQGWWHPPSCMASWPEHEAVEMARRDQQKGLRMNRDELHEYLQYSGIRDVNEYIQMCEAADES